VSKNGKRKRFEREIREFKLEVLASSRKRSVAQSLRFGIERKPCAPLREGYFKKRQPHHDGVPL